MPAIVVIAAGTAVWLAYNWFQTPVNGTQGEAVVEAKISEIAQINEELDFSMPPIDSFDAILIRPIFSPNRRATAAAKVVAMNQSLAVQLMGIVGDDSDKRILLKPGDGGETVNLRKGEEYRGWIFEKVDESGEVVLRNDAGDVATLRLDYEVAPKPTAQSRRDQRRKQAQQAQQKTLRQRAVPVVVEDDEDDEDDEAEEQQENQSQ